jgi:pyrroline-5-carboxylate reductase
MKLGFIGTGAIAEAVIVGMLEAKAFDGKVIVSRRSESRSQMLSQRFENVQVETDNQRIVDQADWVFVSVLPAQAEELLRNLNFRREQFLISMVAGRSLASLAELVAPVNNVFRIIPLPPIEMGLGPLPITPPNDDIAALFDRFGTAVQVEDEEQFSAFSASSALMASFYKLVASQACWIENQGVPAAQAAKYATAIIHSLAETTLKKTPEALQGMAEECLTIGGLNEQVLNESLEEGWFTQMDQRLDRIAERLAKAKESGSV